MYQFDDDGMARVSRRFGFAEPEYWDDWDVVNADPERIGEFARSFIEDDWTAGDRQALFALFVKSCDSALELGYSIEPAWSEVIGAIGQDLDNYRAVLEYWSDDEDPDEWAIAPIVRGVLGRQK